MVKKFGSPILQTKVSVDFFEAMQVQPKGANGKSRPAQDADELAFTVYGEVFFGKVCVVHHHGEAHDGIYLVDTRLDNGMELCR